MDLNSKLGQKLSILGSVYRKFGIILIVLTYIFKVYGSLLLYSEGYIGYESWASIHFAGVQLIFIMFTLLVKKHINILIYSICIGIFASRLISQLMFSGFESYYEITMSALTPILIYFISKYVGRTK